jgi:arabinogalactan oligomer / maltooligosaccharide transport system substrate-binding protein
MFAKKSRFVALGAAAALSVSGLAAVAPAYGATKTITVWTDESRGPDLKALLTGRTPVAGHTVKVKIFSNLEALNAAWNSATAATGPDVIISNAGLAASGGKSGKLVPLTLPSSVRSQFAASAFNALSFQGKVYGIPLDVDTTGLFWNSTLFGKKAPTTFGAMVNYYKANKDSKNLSAGFCAQEGEWGSHPVITALGGGAWKYKGSKIVPKETKFNSTAFKANIQKYLLGSAAGFLKVGGDCINDFKAGRIPFMNTGGWNLSGIKSSDVKFRQGQVPGVKAGTFGSPWAGYQGAFVSKFAKSHGVASGANSLVVGFMANSITQAQLSTLGNRPPASIAAASRVTDPALKQFARSGAQGVLQLSALLDDDTAGANWYGLVGDVWNKILNEGEPVGATLDAAAAKMIQNFKNGAKSL